MRNWTVHSRTPSPRFRRPDPRRRHPQRDVVRVFGPASHATLTGCGARIWNPREIPLLKSAQVRAAVSTSHRTPLLTLASSPGTDRLRVLEITLRSLRGLTTWIDLGCGEAEPTAAMGPLVPRIGRVSVDVIEPTAPPDGFVRSSIPDYLAQHELGPQCVADDEEARRAARNRLAFVQWQRLRN
jgi:hypothetical protein